MRFIIRARNEKTHFTYYFKRMNIQEPKNTYFIRSFKKWNSLFDLIYPEVSVSLHKDGFTKSLYSMGFILKIKSGGIIAAYDRDVTSYIDLDSKLPNSCKNWRIYKEDELEDLMQNTLKENHNEIIIRSSFAEIIGTFGSKIMKKAYETTQKF